MSKEELKQLKEDVTEIQEKLRMLTDEKLKQVTGGSDSYIAVTDVENHSANASFVKNGKFVYVGNEDGLKINAGEIVDFEGNKVLPT